MRAILGAFALGSLASLGQIGFIWPLMGVVAGVAFPTQRLASAAGLLAAAFTWGSLRGQLAPPLAFEGPDYALLYGWLIGTVATGLALAVTPRLLPGSRAGARPADRPTAGWRTPRALPTGPAVLAALGVVAIAMAVITEAGFVTAPSRRSFAIDLPAGWVQVDTQPMNGYVDPSYGNHFTAMFGAPDLLPAEGPPPVPVLGVTVIRFETTPRDCILSIHGWSPSGPVYEGEILASMDIQLPAGPAHRIVRTPFDDGTRLYGWGLTHARDVGVLHEDLCYMLVLTVPEGTSVTETDADAIAASFRFR